MRNSIALSALAAATGALAVPAPSDCATGLHIIVARGSSEEPGMGRAGVVAGNITLEIPGSDSVGVDYPATFSAYDDSKSEGSSEMAHMVFDYKKQCPDTKIALIGFSQGAHALMDLLCNTDIEEGYTLPAERVDEFWQNVVAAVAFGDPSHSPGHPWNAGDADTEGLFPRPDDAIDQCKPYADRIRSWCDEGDIYCDRGKDRTVHGSYYGNYTDDATEFVVKQYKEAIEGDGPNDGKARNQTTSSGPAQPTVTTPPIMPIPSGSAEPSVTPSVTLSVTPSSSAPAESAQPTGAAGKVRPSAMAAVALALAGYALMA